jgi:hypothetical protein
MRDCSENASAEGALECGGSTPHAKALRAFSWSPPDADPRFREDDVSTFISMGGP